MNANEFSIFYSKCISKDTLCMCFRCDDDHVKLEKEAQLFMNDWCYLCAVSNVVTICCMDGIFEKENCTQKFDTTIAIPYKVHSILLPSRTTSQQLTLWAKRNLLLKQKFEQLVLRVENVMSEKTSLDQPD